jgi:hypothetical protein
MVNPSVSSRRLPFLNLFAAAAMSFGLAVLPVAANAASAKTATSNAIVGRQAAKDPFQFKASASVQKGLDLLKKYGIPESALKNLITVLCDKAEVTKVLKGLKLIKLTDAQISEFADAAYLLATDKKDPLTSEAFKTWVADGMSVSLKAKKVSSKDGAKLAVLGGGASKPGSKTIAAPSLDTISAGLKQAEPTLSDKDIADLMFWYSLGYDQLAFEVFQVIYLREELTYYNVPADEITAILKSYDDPKALDAELAKITVDDSIRQSMLDTYNEKLAELGPQACGCAAMQAILLTAKSILEANGVPLADQLAIQQAFEKGDMAEVAKLATAAGVPAEQLQEFSAAVEEVKALAGSDYQAFMADQQSNDQATQDPTQLDQSIDQQDSQLPIQEPSSDQLPLDESGS